MKNVTDKILHEKRREYCTKNVAIIPERVMENYLEKSWKSGKSHGNSLF